MSPIVHIRTQADTINLLISLSMMVYSGGCTSLKPTHNPKVVGSNPAPATNFQTT